MPAPAKPIELVFEIDPEGGVQMEVFNGDGKNCVEISSAFQRVLGETISDVKKPEFYKDDRETRTQLQVKA